MSAIQKVLGHRVHHVRVAIATGIAVAVTIGAPAPPAHAAAKSSTSGTKSTTTASAMSLSSQSTWNNPYAPPWCKTEDDYDFRTFSGSLSGSYSTSYYLCNPAVDYYNGTSWDAGGEGLQSSIAVVGQLSSLTITAPDGSVHSAVLMGQSTSKGVTTYDYAVCYVPPYYLSSNTGAAPLQGGTWQITLSGQISQATWTTRDTMTDVNFQQSYCPASEQNLL